MLRKEIYTPEDSKKNPYLFNAIVKAGQDLSDEVFKHLTLGGGKKNPYEIFFKKNNLLITPGEISSVACVIFQAIPKAGGILNIVLYPLNETHYQLKADLYVEDSKFKPEMIGRFSPGSELIGKKIINFIRAYSHGKPIASSLDEFTNIYQQDIQENLGKQWNVVFENDMMIEIYKTSLMRAGIKNSDFAKLKILTEDLVLSKIYSAPQYQLSIIQLGHLEEACQSLFTLSDKDLKLALQFYKSSASFFSSDISVKIAKKLCAESEKNYEIAVAYVKENPSRNFAIQLGKVKPCLEEVRQEALEAGRKEALDKFAEDFGLSPGEESGGVSPGL